VFPRRERKKEGGGGDKKMELETPPGSRDYLTSVDVNQVDF
jgi:hypothetical protein